MSVNYLGIIALLVEAVKEQNNEILKLKNIYNENK